MCQKEKARRLSGAPLIWFPTSATTIEPKSPPADASAVGIPPAARTRTNDDGGAIEAITSAIAPASATAVTAGVSARIAPAASASVRLRGRGRSAYQNRRRADEVDEEQSQRCEAAGQDVVAFSHSRISGSLPCTWTSALSHLDARESFRFGCAKTIFLLRFFRAGGTLLRRGDKVKLRSDLLGILVGFRRSSS
jgi:hypothetical protein